jgi:hypothetical protein
VVMRRCSSSTSPMPERRAAWRASCRRSSVAWRDRMVPAASRAAVPRVAASTGSPVTIVRLASPRYPLLTDRAALYPRMFDLITLDGEVVIPQPGGFYGGWITADVVGPFKGESGTSWW